MNNPRNRLAGLVKKLVRADVICKGSRFECPGEEVGEADVICKGSRVGWLGEEAGESRCDLQRIQVFGPERMM